MSDLINREDVLKILEDTTYNREIPKNHGTLLDITKAVNELPVSYDVDKVVEQLENNAKQCENLGILCDKTKCGQYYDRWFAKQKAYMESAKIVRKGGVE